MKLTPRFLLKNDRLTLTFDREAQHAIKTVADQISQIAISGNGKTQRRRVNSQTIILQKTKRRPISTPSWPSVFTATDKGFIAINQQLVKSP